MREVIDSRGLTIDAFAGLLGEKPQRIKDVLGGKQRAPADMLAKLATWQDVDIQYVLTGTRTGEISTATKIRDAHDTGAAFVANLFSAHKLPRDPALMNAIVGVDIASEQDARIRGGLSNLAMALREWRPTSQTATPITAVAQPVARSVQPLDEPLLRSVMLGVEDFIRLQDLSPPADEKVALIVKVYAIFRERKQSKASRANVVEFLRAA